MTSPLAAAWTLAALLALSACSTTEHAGHRTAVAHLASATGTGMGHAKLTEVDGGVQIEISVEGLSPGLHGFHVHTNGVCAPGPDAATGQTVAFGAAGGHFDPGQSKRHGRPGQPMHEAHAGELPNISVAADGRGSLRYLNTHISLSGQALSVLGRSLVVHERADDYATNPAGNSGPRLLCGVIEAATAAR